MEKTSCTSLAVVLSAALSAAQLSADTVTVCPKATDEALINPDMGFVYYKYSNRLWAYGINTPENDTLDWFPGCSCRPAQTHESFCSGFTSPASKDEYDTI